MDGNREPDEVIAEAIGAFTKAVGGIEVELHKIAESIEQRPTKHDLRTAIRGATGRIAVASLLLLVAVMGLAWLIYLKVDKDEARGREARRLLIECVVPVADDTEYVGSHDPEDLATQRCFERNQARTASLVDDVAELTAQRVVEMMGGTP